MKGSKKSKWMKVFCPEQACLREEERFDLPQEERSAEHDAWLDLFCPLQACEITGPSQLP